MDMCIALRTAVLKDEKLYVQAGGGVVYDSDPEAEYMETVHKSSAIRRGGRGRRHVHRRGQWLTRARPLASCQKYSGPNWGANWPQAKRGSAPLRRC